MVVIPNTKRSLQIMKKTHNRYLQKYSRSEVKKDSIL